MITAKLKPRLTIIQLDGIILAVNQVKKANNIGELVDSQWQAWRNALLQNMWLNNITPEKITYKGL